MSYELVLLVGNLTADPEMRYTPAGKAVTSFSIAVNDDYKDANGVKVERVKYIRVSCWGGTAEAVNQWKKKGDAVLVEGKLNGEWKDKNGKKESNGPKVWTANDGTPHASFEINAQSVRFLGGSRNNQGAQPAGNTAAGPAATATADDDDIPF